MVPEAGQIPNQNYVELNKRIESGRFRPEKNMKLFVGSANGGTQSKNISNMWVERGSYEVGGRVRGIMFDPNDPTGKKVRAGAVSGGLW